MNYKVPQPDWRMPTTAEFDAVRPDWLRVIDVQGEILRAAALEALRNGKTVNVVLDGRVMVRFHPDGTTETPYVD